jgi:lipopolysaccharide/colanic/teichoic acid biosynthesis glycosyltransferase
MLVYNNAEAMEYRTPIWRRAIDVLLSGGVLLMTSPIIVVTAIAVAADGGPVLYKQTRSGHLGKPFEALKFRSMRPNNLTTAQNAATHGQVTNEHPDVTWVGRIIRRFKIDELPQLVNILRGDMSLLGPRPTVPEQVEEYTAYQFRRLYVRPGLTGWTQVNGGIEFSWRERILIDVWYVAHRSLRLDAEIVLRTLGVILFGEKRNDLVLQQAENYARKELGVDQLIWPQQEHLARSEKPLDKKMWSLVGAATHGMNEKET